MRTKTKFTLDISIFPSDVCLICKKKIEIATGNMTNFKYRCDCGTWGKNEFYIS